MRHDEVLVAGDVDHALRVDEAERRLLDGGRRGGRLAAVGERRGQPGRAQVRRRLLLLLLPLVRLLLEGLQCDGKHQNMSQPVPNFGQEPTDYALTSPATCPESSSFSLRGRLRRGLLPLLRPPAAVPAASACGRRGWRSPCRAAGGTWRSKSRRRSSRRRRRGPRRSGGTCSGTPCTTARGIR